MIFGVERLYERDKTILEIPLDRKRWGRRDVVVEIRANALIWKVWLFIVLEWGWVRFGGEFSITVNILYKRFSIFQSDAWWREYRVYFLLERYLDDLLLFYIFSIFKLLSYVLSSFRVETRCIWLSACAGIFQSDSDGIMVFIWKRKITRKTNG